MVSAAKKVREARHLPMAEQFQMLLKQLNGKNTGFNKIAVHNFYLVNLNEVSKYVCGEGGYLVMSDGASINVSRSRKEVLLKYF